MPPPSGAVAVAGFSRDRVLFDSGAAFGRAVADIPLVGTATAGEVVQARALSLDDGGATTTAWVDAGTADGGGNWTGTITAPRSASWFRVEVRLKANPGITNQAATRFGVGHVIAIWGQSEPDRIISGFYDNTTPPAVSDPEAVQIIQGAAATPAVTHVSNAQPVTAAVAAMAGTLITARPGEKFALIFHTVPGTDPRELVNDSNAGRMWANDKALHDFATADGQKVGIAAMSWFAAPGNLGSNYAAALFPLFSGKTTAGAPVSFPTDIVHPGGSYHADHWFGELYDYAHTKWAPYGPHRVDIAADHQDATHFTGGAANPKMQNREAVRQSWRAMLALPDATMFLPLGSEPMAYVNGYDDGAGSWTDQEHPAGNTPDGAQRFARLTAHAILKSAGLAGWTVPVFDTSLWEPSGAWVEVWSSAGPVTTTRLQRAEAPLGTTYSHWTTVVGFQINGVPARNTQIVAGRVRILPNSGVFTNADAITFGEGGATGSLKFPQDFPAGLWKNLPVVDVGLADVGGISVRPLPSPAALTNTLPAGAPSFHTSATGPYFVNPANVPAGTSAITFAARIRFSALPATTSMLFSQSSTGFDVELNNSGGLRITIEDGTGAKMLQNYVFNAGLVPNVWYDLVCSANQATAVHRIMINGVLADTMAFTATGNGLFQSTRALSFLARNSGTPQFEGEVEYLRVWHSATATGAAPAGAPFKQITGPASVANADSWKLGANAT
ncbi:MAG: hypothetical protein KDE03_02900 [Rhodobacteraceae bacterium]|nr:hypothetical protein [Paracoccaceae bacterium]